MCNVCKDNVESCLLSSHQQYQNILFDLMIIRRDGRTQTTLSNFNLSNLIDNEEILQAGALGNLRKCLTKGFSTSSSDIQTGLIDFLKLTFPQFKYLFRLLSKDNDSKKKLIYNLLQSMKLVQKHQGFHLMTENATFDYMYILIAGSVAIYTKQENRSHSLEPSEVKQKHRMPRKKLLNTFFIANQSYNTRPTTQQKTTIISQKSIQLVEEEKPRRIVNTFTLFGDKVRLLDGKRLSAIVINEDYTELVQAPIQAFWQAFLDEVDLQEIREKVKALKQLYYFTELNTRVLSGLLVNAQVLTLARGQYLYKQNDVLDWKFEEKKKSLNIYFYIVRKGTLRVTQVTKINLNTKEGAMNQKIKKHESDICLLSEGEVIGMEEIMNQKSRRLNSVVSNSNESQVYQVLVNDIRDKLVKVMQMKSKTKDKIEEFIRIKLDLEEEIGEKIKQGTLTSYYNPLSRNDSDIKVDLSRFDHSEDQNSHINITYQDSQKFMSQTEAVIQPANLQLSQKKLSHTFMKEDQGSIYVRSRNSSENLQDSYGQLIEKKKQVLSSIRLKDRVIRNSKFKIGEFNFTQDLYNVRTLEGSNQIINQQVKQQSKKMSSLGYVKQKWSRDLSSDDGIKSKNDLSLIALNKYFQKTLSQEKKRSRQWQTESVDCKVYQEKPQSKAIITLKRKLRKSRREKLNKVILNDNYLKIKENTKSC